MTFERAPYATSHATDIDLFPHPPHHPGMHRRGFLLTSLAGIVAVLAPPVLAQDAYVYVQGEVRKPGTIPYTSGMTFRQAIALAGGFTATASPRETYLIRGRDTRRVDLRDFPVYPVIDPELRPGDIIQVRQRFF